MKVNREGPSGPLPIYLWRNIKMYRWGRTYNRNRHNYKLDEEKSIEEKKRQAYAINMRNKELKDEEEAYRRVGICPHCHMQIPLNGKCPCQE